MRRWLPRHGERESAAGYPVAGDTPAGNHYPIKAPIFAPPNHPSKPLKVITVVNGGGDGRGGNGGGGDGASNTVAGAGRCVGGAVVAGSGGVGGESAGRDGGGAVLEVTLGGGGGGLVVDGDGDGAISTVRSRIWVVALTQFHLHSIRGDGGQEEALAVGRADAGGRETIAGTGDGAVAVVTGAGALLDSHVGEGNGHEGQDDSELHLDRLVVWTEPLGWVAERPGSVCTGI